MLYTIIITLLYFFIVAYLGYVGYRQTKTSRDYLIAGRQIHPFIMALSYGSTFISTSAIVGFGGAAGQLGMGLLWLTVLNIFVGIFVAFVIFGKRTRQMGHNLDSHTFPEFLGQRFGSKFIQGFAGIVIFLFMPIYAAAVLKGGVDFIQSYFSIDFGVALFFFTAIVALYVWMGGLKGVMYTDAFQALVMFAGMALLIIYTYAKLGGVVTAHTRLTELFANPEVQKQAEKLVKGGFQGWTSMPKFASPIWWNLVSTIVMGVGIGVLAQPQLVVRFMTVKSNRELNRAVLSGGIFILMMTGVAFAVGALSNVAFFDATGKIALVAAGANDKIIPEYIKLFLPAWFGSIFLITLLAAAMSTMSSQYHTMGAAIGRDFCEQSLGYKGNTIFITKLGILIAVLITAVLAYLTKYLDVSMAIIATGTALFFGLCAASFLPAYVGALYCRTLPRAAAISGMVGGFLVSAFWIFFVHEKESSSLQLCKLITGKNSVVLETGLASLKVVDPIFVALPASTLITLVVWAIYRAGARHDIPKEHVNRAFAGI
jgi:solute:Na+ symporter, SSS family